MKEILKTLRKKFFRSEETQPKPKANFVTLHNLDAWKALYARNFINGAITFSEENGGLAQLRKFTTQRESLNDKSIPADLLDISLIAFLIRISGSQRVLEMGSGCSTVAILNTLLSQAQEANQANFKPYFLSLDNEHEWAEVNKKLVDTCFTTLPDWFELRYSETSLIEVEGGTERQFSYSYDFKVDKPYDFIYVDGPDLIKARHSCDIMKEGILTKQTIICADGRWDTVKLIRNFIPDWTVLKAPYPSNDTYFIHTEHNKYRSIVAHFGLIEGDLTNF